MSGIRFGTAKGAPYFWFQLRTENAKRRARYMNRLGELPSDAERSEIRRALGEDLLRSTRHRDGPW